MSSLRSAGTLPALAVAAVVTAVLGLAACGSDSDPAPAPTLTCAAYCTTLTTNCTAGNAQFTSEGACNDYCTKALAPTGYWTAGTAGATSGNSLACRTYHGGAPAVADAALHCPHAGPSGGNFCGTWCANYCDLALSACTGGLALYADRAACETACAGIPAGGVPNATSGNTLQCRIYHLGVAASSTANAAVHCPHGNAAPTGPCS